jgi:metal-sulfur cluster biosynthetic enzyme
MSASSARLGETGAEYPHDDLWDALRTVPDPEMAISIVDMGLVVAAQRTGATANITLTYTAMGCPAMQMIEEDVQAALLAIPGIDGVKIETVWLPVWTKSRLSADGRDALLLQGVAL